MNASLPKSLDLAYELLGIEAASSRAGMSLSGGTNPTPTSPAILVCSKLGKVLAGFAGSTGFRSLLTRAVSLATPHAPTLANVKVLEDGTLEGLPSTKDSEMTQSDSASAYLVAYLLDLLITFVGDSLTYQLVSIAWPNVPIGAVRRNGKDLT